MSETDNKDEVEMQDMGDTAAFDDEDVPFFGEKFNLEEEELLDRKYQSSWTPRFMNNSPKWRLLSRMAICGVGIALLWLTSLEVATQVASLYVATPTYDAVVEEWVLVADLAETERTASDACVDRQLSQCFTSLDESSNQYQKDSSESAGRNTQKLILRDGLRLGCLDAHYKSLGSVGKYLNAQALDANIDAGNIWAPVFECSEEDKELLISKMADGAQAKSELYAQNADYVRNSQGSLERIRVAIDMRVAYDQSYAYNKSGVFGEFSSDLRNVATAQMDDIAGTLDELDPQLERYRLCSSPGANSNGIIIDPPCPVNATELYNAFADELTDELIAYELAYEENLAIVNQYMGEVSAYAAKVEALTNALSGIDELLSTAAFDMDVLNVGSPPSLSLNTQVDLPTVKGVDEVFPPVDMDGLYDDLGNALEDTKNNVDSKIDSATNNLNYVADQIDNPFDDYDPPQINGTIREEQANHTAASDEYLEKTRTALGNFDTSDAMFDSNVSGSDFGNSFRNLSWDKSQGSFYIETYGKNLDPYNALEALASIQLILLSADTIYRVMRTFMLIFKYMAMSEVGLPTVDVRKFKASKKRNYQMRMLQCMTHPYCMLIYAAIVGALLVIACAAFYVPMYVSYYEGCVTQESEDGTFVTNTSFVFAYNWASQDYNREVGEGLAEYDERRSTDCSLYGEDSITNYTGTVEFLYSIEERLTILSQDMVLFDRCVVPDSPALLDDIIVQNNFSNVGPFTDDAIQSRQLCASESGNIPDLEDSRFNCTNLPICAMTCGGPDKEALAAATLSSGCASEWKFHAGMFRFVMAMMVYVCLNISRVLVMMAVVRLSWRVLAGKGFEFVGTVDRLGNMDITAKDRLKKQVDTDIRKYERAAWIMLLLAVLVHIPYIIVLEQYGSTV